MKPIELHAHDKVVDAALLQAQAADDLSIAQSRYATHPNGYSEAGLRHALRRMTEAVDATVKAAREWRDS